MKIVHGIRIYTLGGETVSAIGLENGVFYWIENGGIAPGIYKTGLILNDDLGPIEEGAELQRSGGLAELRGFSFMVKNSDLLYKTLSDNNIDLNGLRCERVEFISKATRWDGDVPWFRDEMESYAAAAEMAAAWTVNTATSTVTFPAGYSGAQCVHVEGSIGTELNIKKSVPAGTTRCRVVYWVKIEDGEYGFSGGVPSIQGNSDWILTTRTDDSLNLAVYVGSWSNIYTLPDDTWTKLEWLVDCATQKNSLWVNGEYIGAYDFRTVNTSIDYLQFRSQNNQAEIWSLDGVEVFTDTSAYDERILMRGITSIPRWTETEYQINVDPIFSARRSNIATVISEGNREDSSQEDRGAIIPASFGQIEYAKFVRTARAAEKVVMSYNEFPSISAFGLFTEPFRNSYFPVTADDSTTTPVQFTIRVSSIGIWSGLANGTYYPTEWNGYILRVVKGTGKGQLRAIESVSVTIANASADYNFDITITHAFETALVTSGTNQSWVVIESIQRLFEADTWPCKAYMDSNGSEITQNLELYSFEREKTVTVTGDAETVQLDEKPKNFKRLPENAYKDNASGSNNAIEIKTSVFEDDPDRLLGFAFARAVPSLMEDGNLNAWVDTDGHIEAATRRASGLYTLFPSGNFNFYETNTVAAISDKDYETYHQLNFSDGNQVYYNAYLAYEFDRPTVPAGLSFKDVYMGLQMLINFTTAPSITHKVVIKYRRFLGDATTIKVCTHESSDGDDQWRIQDIQDEYFELPVALDSDNKYFFPAFDGVDVGTEFWHTGFATFKLSDVVSEEEYNSIEKFAVFIKMEGGTTRETVVKFYEACLMFKKQASVDKEIYSPFKGRIFNSDMDGRKSHLALIENPIDILEHVCRLQNFADNGDTTTEFGKAYSPNALINLKAEPGGFDNASVNPVRSITTAFQCLQYADCWTDALKLELCRTFFLVNWQNIGGAESVEFLAPESGDIVVTDAITLADVPEGETIGDYEPPNPDNIFAEPIVRYNYNWANGEPQDAIEVKNIHVGAWQSSFTPGISDGIGETIYDLCYELWKKSRKVNEAPSYLTDKWMIKNYTDAVWYLETWVRWQGLSRITVPVYYEKARLYHVGKFVSLNLPHQTNGETIGCFVENMRKDKNRNLTQLKLCLIGEIPDAAWIQKTYNDDDPKWQKTYNDGDTPIQKVY